MKTNALIACFGVITAILNFGLFLVLYNKLATPYLHEEQRVENADFIMSYALAGYVLLALLAAFAVWLFCKKPKA